nr:hypothetical protein [Microbacterium lemovicicum]
MTAAEAALEAARLGLIGTIVVGILATLGTLVGTLLAPFLIRRSEAKAAEASRRREEMVEIIPALVRSGLRAAMAAPELEDVIAPLPLYTKFATLLRPADWQVGNIALRSFLNLTEDEDGMQRASVAAEVLPRWARGEIDAAQAAAIFTRDTGLSVGERDIPDVGRGCYRRRLSRIFTQGRGRGDVL